MPQLLLELLPELIEHIYSYCSISDLLSVACCNKEYNDAVQFRLWRRVQLPCNIDMKSSSRTHQFRFIRNLTFCDKNESVHQPTAKQLDSMVDNYVKVLSQCDTRKLMSLTFNNFCCNQVLKVASDILKNLQELSLYKCEGITETGWKTIQTFSDLKQLELFQCGIRDADIKNIVGSLSLKKLILNQCKELSSDCLKYISAVASLEMLSVSCWQFKDAEAGLNVLSTMKSLKTLSVTGYYHASNDAIVVLNSLTSLQELDLSCSPNLSDSGLATLSSLPYLKNLNICDCNKVTDAGVGNLAGNVVGNFLQVLNMSGCWKISDFGLSQVKEMKSLRELNIGGCRFITDVGICHLVNVKSLRRLNISGCFYVTDIGLAELSNLTLIRELSMGACCITDLGICQLLVLTKLQSLGISECHRVTDFGLSEISKMSSLKKLNINGCVNITFIGLAQLTDLKLEELNLKHCGLSDESVEQFCLYSGMKELSGVDGCMNSRILTRNYRLWTKHFKRWENNNLQGV